MEAEFSDTEMNLTECACHPSDSADLSIAAELDTDQVELTETESALMTSRRLDFETVGTGRNNFVEMADQIVTEKSGRIAPAALFHEMLSKTGAAESFFNIESISLPHIADVFDAITYNLPGRLRQQLGQNCEVVALPGTSLQRLDLHEGDIGIRRGEGELAHFFVIAEAKLRNLEVVLSEGLTPERLGPGNYAMVVETGARPHTSSDKYARTLTNSAGHLLNDILILRLLTPQTAATINVQERSKPAEPGTDSERRSSESETTPPPSRSTKGTRAQLVDFNSAKNVMWEVIRILSHQYDVNSADPDRSTTTEPWFRQYKPLLKEWYLLTYGELSGKSRVRLKGDALRVKLEAVVTMTQPLLDALKAHGGKEWTKQLAWFVYPRIADFEYEAVETMPKSGNPAQRKPVEFPDRPKAVSVDEFFSVVAAQESQPVEISRGYGGFSLGTATVGAVFSASQQDHRVLLWSNGQVVFFMRDGVIFAQSARWFSEDIIMGAFVLAAQHALGSAILAQLMVEVALSFTPWGTLADGVFAFEALTRGSWKEAALTFLPGHAIGLASKTRAVRAVAHGAVFAATIGAQVVKRTIRFIGRGAYRVGGKLLRGIWIVGESGGAAGERSYRFFDEVGKLWQEIPETTAYHYVKCSRCQFTPAGFGEAVEGAVDEIVEDLVHAPGYASRGQVLLSRKLIKDVVEAYGPWGDYVVEKILDTWSSAPNAAKLADETLRIAEDLSRIKGSRGYMDAIDIFEDLASSSVHTARGTMYELRWAAQHVDEIAALGIPVSRRGWVGKGLDVLKKSGEAIELKNFDFTSEFYRGDPGRSVARIIKQVESRLKYKDVTKVTVLFSSEAGKMPALFGQQLTEAMNDLALRTRRKSAEITFQFWP
jgi:hypothetical protein